MEILDFLFSLTHGQIMYYSCLITWFILSIVVKGKATYEMIVGKDGKPQIPEVFQYLSMNGAVVYGLEHLYYGLTFNFGAVLFILVLALTGDIREAIKIRNENIKK